MKHSLVIGIGNEHRGDDCAGILVADKVKKALEPKVDVITHDGEPASLIECWSNRETVFLVDAIESGKEPGTILRLDLKETTLPDILSKNSTHAFGVAEAVELGRAMEKLPDKLLFFGIEGKSFTVGGALSKEVGTAIEQLTKEIIEECSHA